MDLKNKENLKTQVKTEDLQPEEELKDFDPDYEQSPEQNARVQFIEKEVEAMRQQRDQGYKFFGFKDESSSEQKYLTLIDYINESEKRINGTLEKSELKDEWQSNVFDNITRDKLNSIIAKLASQRMKAQFLNIEGLSTEFAKVITNIYEAAARGKNGKGKDEVFLFNSMWEAAAKGTVVREETYKLGKRKIKDHELFNKQGKIKYKTIYEWEDVWSEIVPLHEFYPGDISKQNIQEMGKCARVTWLDYETFRVAFSDYAESEKVQPIKEITQEEKTMFSINESAKDMVKVIRYYNRITDSYDVSANGFLLTPINNPLPHPHKQLPFNVGRFEILSINFFYGMSLAMKLSSMQDIDNAIWNMMLDQLFIALKTPIFNATGAEIDTNWLYPSQVIDLPKKADLNQIREFQVNPNSTLAMNALGMIKSRIDENASSGSEQSGIAGAGRAKTAEEVATAREASLEIAGLFLQFMEWAEEDRSEQRCQNMLYYYSKPLKSNGKYRKFVVDNVRLLNQELGTMFVNIASEPQPQERLDEINMQTDEMSQVIEITPELIRNFKYLVKIVPNSSLKDTQYQRVQKELQWYSYTANNPMVNQKENIKALAEAYGKDVSKILNTEKPQEAPGMEGIPEEMLKTGGSQSGATKTLVPLRQ
jgi:hypothetical protein